MMSEVWLITGIPGAGQSTTARLLAQKLGRGVHIDGDDLQGWIQSGGVWPSNEPRAEANRQIVLNGRSSKAIENTASGWTLAR